MRKLGYVLGVLTLILALAACGREQPLPETQSTQPQETTAAAVPARTTTITALVARNGQNTAQWWADYEQTYEEENPGVDLVVQCEAWYDIDGALRQRIDQGNTPDLVNADNFRQYRDRLLPAKQWVSQETYSKFYPALHERATEAGEVWGIPDGVTARALYYNASLLGSAGTGVPRTWSELVSACHAIRMQAPDVWPWGVDMTTDEGYACFAYYIWNNGSGFVDGAGGWMLNTPKNVEAVEFITDMVHKGLTNPNPAGQTRYELQERFAQGKIAMMIAPSTLSAQGALQDLDYGIAPLPVNGDIPPVSTASGNYFLCFAREGRTDRELAAITAFADAFYEDAPYAQWVRMEGLLPATTTANALLQAQEPEMAVWDQILGGVRFWPDHLVQWAEVSEGIVAVLHRNLQEGNAWLLLEELQGQVTGS